jgi:hypothetical protein
LVKNKKNNFRLNLLVLISLSVINSVFTQTHIQLNLIKPPPSDISSGAAMFRQKTIERSEYIMNRKPFKGINPFPLIKFDPIISFEGINFMQDGINNNGLYNIPPDPIGASGLIHVVSVVNTSIEWYTKTGFQQNSESLSSFFSSLSPLTETFDPKVIYDQYANRFLVVALEFTDTTFGDPYNSSRIFIAVSANSDPNNGWYFHTVNSKLTFLNPNTNVIQEHWADYPGIAVDDQAVFICNNMFTFGSNRFSGGSRLWMINKGIGNNGFYEGGVASITLHDAYAATPGSIPLTTQPTHMYGNSPGNTGTFLVSYNGITQGGPGGQEVVQIIRVDNPTSAPAFSHQFVFVGDIEDIGGVFGFPELPDAPQLGSTHTIEVNDRRTLNAVWRNNALWITTTLNPNMGPDAGQTTAHWWKLNTVNLNNITYMDQGNVGGEDIATSCFTFFPSLAVNMSGDMGIGFAASAASIYPGAYYTGRLYNDPPGTVQQSVTLRAGLDYYFRAFGGNRNRWGDYSGISVDPADNHTFWAFNQYAITRGTILPGLPLEDGRWGTAWCNFGLPLVEIKSDFSNLNYPDKFVLRQNYPNPFNPSTNITIQLYKKTDVRLTIFNALGKKITTLISNTLLPGSHTIEWNAEYQPSGIYYCILEIENYSVTRKMILLK